MIGFFKVKMGQKSYKKRVFQKKEKVGKNVEARNQRLPIKSHHPAPESKN